MRIKRILISVILVSCSVLFVGCWQAVLIGGAAAGIGTYAYINGSLERKYPVGFDRAWKATLDALKEYHFTVENSPHDNITGTISARNDEGTTATIKFELLSDEVTSVKIRIGTFGDRKRSELIHEFIKKGLGMK